MTFNIIKTDVKCPNCQEPLCNLCGFNGRCEDCGTPINRTTDAALVKAIHALKEA